MIVTLQLSPGTVLSEQALAVRLKIGRTPIREALQRLARDGLVVIMPRRGIMVSEINLRLQLRLLEVRRELERLMASLAAERATPEERREFAEWQKPCSPQPQRPTTSYPCGSTSANILTRPGPKRIRPAIDGADERCRAVLSALSAGRGLPLAAKLHAAVAEAVAQKKAKAAATASDRLIDYIEDSRARRSTPSV
jgi:DNA-binding GntR family transcriptional regulator